MNTHVAYLTKLNYRADIAIYTYLDDYTVNSKHVCLPSFAACTASDLFRLCTRICAVAEDLIHGTGVFLISPFSKNPSETRKKSWKILKEIRTEFREVLILPFRYIYHLVLAFGEPKMLIIEGVEYAERYREHLNNNTVGTQEWDKDFENVGAIVYAYLLKWQKKPPIRVKVKDLKREENGYFSWWLSKNAHRRHEFQMESKI